MFLLSLEINFSIKKNYMQFIHFLYVLDTTLFRLSFR